MSYERDPAAHPALRLRPQDLVGAWDLVSFQIFFSDGRPSRAPFGETASGRLIYDEHGSMSATLSESARLTHDGIRLESARNANETDRAAAYDSYMAYDGRWRLEHIEASEEQLWGRRGVVIHEVVHALTPNAVGQEHRRHALLIGDQLTLSYAIIPRSGVRRDYRLIWRRMPAQLVTCASSLDDRAPLGVRWLDRYQAMLAHAVKVTRSRDAWTPFIESPSRKLHPEGARQRGWDAYRARLHKPFQFSTPLAGALTSTLQPERSPYTGEALEVAYPEVNVDELFSSVARAGSRWTWASVTERAGVCLEILTRWAEASFEIAFATMHTAGQGFMLAFAGSGASSLDRGLEALAAAWIALREVPENALYERTFGGSEPARLLKRYHCSPVGTAVVFSCGSYPAWNAYPAILANLITGNPVIVKPHPQTILPVAIAVEIAREVIAEAGFDPNLVTLAPDTWSDPVGLKLVDHPQTKIVDFTGGQRFGALLEHRHPRLQVYTETAGCNAVLLHSTADLDATLDALAQGLSLFSAQMCTAPQNLWISAAGFEVYQRTDTECALIQTLSPEDFGRALAERIDHLLEDPQRAAGICGALHADQTLKEIEIVRDELKVLGARCVRESVAYPHPDYPRARTATPLIGALKAQKRTPAQAERFGPISFLITADNADEMIDLAADDAQKYGSIAAYAYSVDEAWIAQAERTFLSAGASLGVNLHRQRPMNFTAAFSDFHVTGLNPAGTASLTDPGFVSRRFRVVQIKREVNAERSESPT